MSQRNGRNPIAQAIKDLERSAPVVPESNGVPLEPVPPAQGLQPLLDLVAACADRKAVENTALGDELLALAKNLTQRDLLLLQRAIAERTTKGFAREWLKVVKGQRQAAKINERADAAPVRETRKKTPWGEDKPSVQQVAEQWGEEHTEEWGYDTTLRKWRHWTGTHWAAVEDDDPHIVEMMGHYLEREGCGPTNTTSRVQDALSFARGRCLHTFGTHRGLIAFQNGTLDTATMQIRAHQRADNLTTCLPYDYTPGLATPIIDAALTGLFHLPGSDAVIRCHLGMALLGDTRFHKTPFLVGPPGTGKSTLLDLASLALGLEPGQYAPGHVFAADREGALERHERREDLALLVDELPDELLNRAGTEVFKKMSAHGAIDSRTHNQKPVNAQWKAKIIISSNDNPKLKDDSGACRRRVILLPTAGARDEGNFDIYILEKFAAELGSFADSCIREAQRAYERNAYPVSGAMVDAYDQAMAEGDALKRFVDECCVLTVQCGVNVEVQGMKLFTAYRTWCDANDIQGRVRLSHITLTPRLTAYAPWKIYWRKGRDANRLYGIGLRSDHPDVLDCGGCGGSVEDTATDTTASESQCGGCGGCGGLYGKKNIENTLHTTSHTVVCESCKEDIKVCPQTSTTSTSASESTIDAHTATPTSSTTSTDTLTDADRLRLVGEQVAAGQFDAAAQMAAQIADAQIRTQATGAISAERQRRVNAHQLKRRAAASSRET